MPPTIDIVPHAQHFGFHDGPAGLLRPEIRARQKHLPHGDHLVGARVMPGALHLIVKELHRDLHMDARAITGLAVRIDSPDPASDLEIMSGYAPLLPGPGVAIENHLVDARIEPPMSATAPGQLETPAILDGSRLSTFQHFVYQGMLHILEGLDHVLLVIALALGVGVTRRLIYLVTAFTLGHSVTLIATFLGATPAWPWFIPAVEAAIAASVLYAAVAAMVRKSGSGLVFTGSGLLHGLGFSFVLGEILGRDAPELVPALLAFNIGIEVGQLLILAVTLSIVFCLDKLATPALRPARMGTLAAIAILSSWWVAERLGGFVSAV